MFAALWAFHLAWMVFGRGPYDDAAQPLRALIGGMVFYGETARIMIVAEAGVVWIFAVGLIAGRRWGLVLALIYMGEKVASHLLFVIAYLDNRGEWYHVRRAALEGPSIVLITLYLWIRSHDLIFSRIHRN